MNFLTVRAGARTPLRAFALRPLALACLYTLPLALPAAVRAQAAPDTATLSPVVITANPLGSDALASPSTVLQGQELDLRRSSNPVSYTHLTLPTTPYV